MAELIAAPLGPAGREDRRRLRPRPLVHRRGGQGLRHRRPRRHQRSRRSPAAAARPDERETRTSTDHGRSASPRGQRRPRRYSAPQSRYILPELRRAHLAGLPRVQPVRASSSRSASSSSACRSTTRRQRRDGAAAVPGVDGPRPRHPASTSTPPVARFTAMTAIYDTMQFVKPRHPDGLPRPGGLGRGGAARRRHAGQAVRAAEQPDPDPPALHRGRRPGLRHRDPGQRDPADARAAGGASSPSHTGKTRPSRSATTSSATRSSPPSDAVEYGLIDQRHRLAQGTRRRLSRVPDGPTPARAVPTGSGGRCRCRRTAGRTGR